MRTYSALIAALLLLASAPIAAKTMMSSMASPSITMTGQEHWKPGTGAMAGAQVAVLAGDPSKAGSFYVMRLKLPANTKFGSHFHDGGEYVTVISGTFYVGIGDKLDTSKMTTLGAGSFAYVPPGVHHYAITKGPVVLQLEGVGPFTMSSVEKGGKM